MFLGLSIVQGSHVNIYMHTMPHRVKVSICFIAGPTANLQKYVLQSQQCYQSCKLKYDYTINLNLALNLKCLGKSTEVSFHVIFIY